MFTLPVLTQPPDPPVVVVNTADRVVADNGRVQLTVDKRSGAYSLDWGRLASLQDAFGRWKPGDGAARSTNDYERHVVGWADIRRVRDRFGEGVRITEHHFAAGRTEARHVFWVYKNRPEILVRLELVGVRRVVSARSITPLWSISQVKIPQPKALHALFVPYDNDSYSRYGSWEQVGGSYEVSALYSDPSGPAVVIGSIDHDTWKSNVHFLFNEDNACITVGASGGVATAETHDSELPGLVSGSVVRSPRFVVCLAANWRQGMERYGDLNALVKPPLKWIGDVPFGWSSWSAYKNHVNAQECRAATDFLHDKMPWFRSGDVAYVNLDSFWDNLSPAEIAQFVHHAHKLGLKAGIYYTPFTGWGRLTDRVRGTRYTYGDIALKGASGKPLPKLDGGYPLDPTHPGELARIDQQFDQFIRWGFDYVKLDFMTHGALEGRHFNPRFQTGTQAYNFALQHIVDRLSAKRTGRSIFLDLSIAPLFPSGYAHARRVSCDVFANIGATEYLLNATTYGFWTNHRLYAYNDGDSSCVYQPLGEAAVTEAEARSRFTASVITGGMMIAGDDFKKPMPSQRVLSIFSNRDLLSLAREAPAFWPIGGDTGSKASDQFYWHDADAAYLAVFNLSKLPVTRTVAYPGSRPAGMWRDLWSGNRFASGSSVSLTLAPDDCIILKASLR